MSELNGRAEKQSLPARNIRLSTRVRAFSCGWLVFLELVPLFGGKLKRTSKSILRVP